MAEMSKQPPTLLTGPPRSREALPSADARRRYIPFGGAVMINLMLALILGVAVQVSFDVPLKQGEFLIPVDIINPDQVFPDAARDQEASEAKPEDREPDERSEDQPLVAVPPALLEDAPADELNNTESEDTSPEETLLENLEAKTRGDEGADAATKSAQQAALEGSDNQSDRAPDTYLDARPRNRAELADLFEQIYGHRPSDAPLPAVEAAKEQDKKEDPYAGLTGPEIDALFRQRSLPSVDLPAQIQAGARGDSASGIVAIYCNRVFSDNTDKAAECAGRPEILSGWVDDGTYQEIIRANLRNSGVDPARYGPSGGGRQAAGQRARAAKADEAAARKDSLGAFEKEAVNAATKAVERENYSGITNFGGNERKGDNSATDDPFGFGASPIPQQTYEPGWATRPTREQEEIERLIEEDRRE